MHIWWKLCSFAQNYAYLIKIMLICSKLCSFHINYAQLMKIILVWHWWRILRISCMTSPPSIIHTQYCFVCHGLKCFWKLHPFELFTWNISLVHTGVSSWLLNWQKCLTSVLPHACHSSVPNLGCDVSLARSMCIITLAVQRYCHSFLTNNYNNCIKSISHMLHWF